VKHASSAKKKWWLSMPHLYALLLFQIIKEGGLRSSLAYGIQRRGKVRLIAYQLASHGCKFAPRSYLAVGLDQALGVEVVFWLCS